MSELTVKNESGQVASFYVDGDHDPRKAILEQRIARGELTKVNKSQKSEPVGRVAVLDSDTGLKDERGDFLKSVHGGGLDPDADGDVLGQPSGSKRVDGAIEVGADAVSDAAVAQAEAKPQSEPAKKAAAAKRGDTK